MESELFNALILSRMQFALNISFHILFPSISIALGWILFYFKCRHEISAHPVWMRAYRFWVKIFALTFAIGVVSGITMSFQFGTNWPGYMERVGNIAGPLLGYEVLTAFFLEATFLGVMLFGQHRVPSWMHTLSTFLVAIGTTLSAFWILALNSWMQTPAGHIIQDGVVYADSWFDVIFNPSFPYRFSHTLLASGLTASFLVAGLSAYRILKGDDKRAPFVALKTGITIAAVLIPLQIFVGDLHGLNTLEHQPQKIAAMEANWETRSNVPLILFAIPDEENRENKFELAVPNLASLILTHESSGVVPGLNDFEGEHPPVAPLFFGFRLMVGMGLLMLITSWSVLLLLVRKRELSKWVLRGVVAMTFSGWVATLAGWYVTEIGRQPWLVSGILRTEEAVTNVAPAYIGLSFTLYALLYLFLLGAYIHTLFYMARQSVIVDEYETAPTVSYSDTDLGDKNIGVAN